MNQTFVKRRSYENDLGRVIGSAALLNLDMELTERCNSNCLHCNINLHEGCRPAAERELSTDQWFGILEQAAALGALSVRFTGGEPLLRKDFFRLYLHARKLGMGVMLFTNARLFSAELADLFVKVPPLEKVEVSVYGMSAEVYDRVSGVKGSFKQFIQGLDRLEKNSIGHVVKWVALKENRHETRDFLNWCTATKREKSRGLVIYLDKRGRRDSEEKNRRIESQRISASEAAGIQTWFDPDFTAHASHLCSKHGAAEAFNPFLFDCGAGMSPAVDAYGMLQPCLLLRDPALAVNLGKVSLKQGLESMRSTLKKMKAENTAYLKRCACCRIRNLCEQCPARAWPESGTLDTPVEYLCKAAHIQAQNMGILRKGEKGWQQKTD